VSVGRQSHRRIAPRTGRAQPGAAAGNRLPDVLLKLQRTAGNRAVARALQANGRVLQRASVTTYNGAVSQEWLTELRNIVQAAENSPGATFQFTVPDRFQSAQGPSNTQQTYALGGSYFSREMPSGQTLSVIGPSSAVGTEKYATSVKSSEWLGNRQSGMHGEMALIAEKGEVGWTYATQDNCLFCHGYLQLNGIQHQALRTDPWPQMWRHPLRMFTLQAGSAAVGNVVDIEFRGQHRQYQIFAG